MHIVVATPHFPPESGGPATYAKILAENFGTFGLTVDVVRFQEVRKYRKVLRPFLYLRLLLRAARRADLILTLDAVSTGVPAALAGLILNKPLVAKIVGDCAWERGNQLHGVTASPEEFVHMKRVPLPLVAYRHAQRWVAARATRIIVPGKALKAIVSAWGIPPEKITIIYNSIETAPRGEMPVFLKDLDGFRIVTVGRLIRLKAIDEIIAAVRQVPDAHLIVVGDGPERARLEELARDIGKIHFTGAVRNDAARAIIESADVLVLNSSWETFSHVLIEGLIAGVPIIATDTGGNPEILDGNGILVPVGEVDALAREIRRLKDDPAARDALRSAASKRAQAFSTQTMLKRTKSVLMAAAANG